MESIVDETLMPFKEFEQRIFAYVCELGRDITTHLLERYDKELATQRDTKVYRDKGPRKTTIKTLYGPVEYRRRVYQVKLDDGRVATVYLLDEAMKMDKIGLISSNLAEKIAMTITDATYRDTAEMISNTCGQSVSHAGIWGFVQNLGERISEEEDSDVAKMKSGNTDGKKEIPVLFEEMDGVWLKMQGPDHKKIPSREMKVFTMYEGWEADNKGSKSSRLACKKMLAGMEDSRQFHEKREAFIRSRYEADEIKQRILNGDGGSWIREEYDSDAIFQLDRFHIQKNIKELIRDKKAQRDIASLFAEEKLDEMLEYILIYADSVDSDEDKGKARKNAKKLYRYLNNNREGLLPYHKRGIEIPEPQPGIIHKEMGVQENQNCTLITMRMKHRRMRWGRGANNLAKVLYRKENRELIDTIDRFTDGLITTMYLNEIVEELSAAKAPIKDGKGNPYLDRWYNHMPLLDAMQTASRKAFKRAFVGG